MAKTRVRDLAKELGLRHQRIRTILRDLDVMVRGPQSVVDDEVANRVRDAIEKERAARRQTRVAREVNLLRILLNGELSYEPSTRA